PFKIKTEGITTKIFQQKILFAFNKKPITKDINLLKTFSLFKEHSINLIKTKKKSFIFYETRNLSNAFWHRKRHMVSLPYEKDSTEQNIPTKARPIHMTYELMKYCKKEIQELLNKKLFRPSKSLWNCATFYVNQRIQ
ncbi:hypothetical protein CFOL_v3_14522, partial [Cephalotus follicularis]